MEPCAKSVSKSDYPFAPSNFPTYLSPIAALPTSKILKDFSRTLDLALLWRLSG
jgi:hypothetical protein